MKKNIVANDNLANDCTYLCVQTTKIYLFLNCFMDCTKLYQKKRNKFDSIAMTGELRKW